MAILETQKYQRWHFVDAIVGHSEVVGSIVGNE
jgi:hypothetical protein